MPNRTARESQVYISIQIGSHHTDKQKDQKQTCISLACKVDDRQLSLHVVFGWFCNLLWRCLYLYLHPEDAEKTMCLQLGSYINVDQFMPFIKFWWGWNKFHIHLSMLAFPFYAPCKWIVSHLSSQRLVFYWLLLVELILVNEASKVVL